MPSNHLILCHPLLLLPPVPPSIIVFSNESTLLVRWPKYWSFSFSISPSSKYSFREELIPSLTSGKLQKEGHSQAYSTRPPSITLIPNQTKISQKKLRANITKKHRCKNLPQNISKPPMHHDQVEFIPERQEFLNTCKSVK